MPSRILVTGGAGFIGTALVARLVAQGRHVRVFDNLSRGAPSDAVEVVVGDIRDDASLLAAMVGCDEVIHLAAINGTPNFYSRPASVLTVGVIGMINIGRCISRLQGAVKRLLVASSSEVVRSVIAGEGEALVIPDPTNPRYSYSAGKIISEMIALHCFPELDAVQIFRPYNIYGPNMKPGHVVPDFFQKVLHLEPGQKLPILGAGNETRSFCYIDDFIDGLLLMREQGDPRGIYNIGNPVETTIQQLAKLIGEVCGVENLEVQPDKGLREGEIKHRQPDISKLAALGYKPRVELREGLLRCAESYGCNVKSAITVN